MATLYPLEVQPSGNTLCKEIGVNVIRGTGQEDTIRWLLHKNVRRLISVDNGTT